MSSARFVFRALPGIVDVKALWEKIDEHPNPEWAPEQDQLRPLVDRVSKDLFGLTEEETRFVDEDFDDPQWHVRQEHWEQNFYFAEFFFGPESDPAADDKRELAVWEMLGWDVTDGNGEIHKHLHEFQRQMICATKGLRGRLPGQQRSDHELAEAAEKWGQSLTVEKRAIHRVRRFR